MRKAVASILVPFTSLCSPAAPPEVLYGSVEHQVIGLKEGLFDMNQRCMCNKATVTVMITSVPPDAKMMSSALPPTIFATFSLD